ncbi:MAG: hypothetical protein ISS93_03415, partial [Candidatus Aenigmarchaeota archaeon]|nr:hypothetical protein [Candidatus Aenigmarchaeota archaeon]
MMMKLFALVVSITLLSLPITSATQVNILFNGNPQETASISPQNMVNKKISVIHDPKDLTWSKVNLLVTINSASLAHSVERIFLFKCKLLDPAACSKVAPIDFETFADTKLLWNDISANEGPGSYPQSANIMTLVKLKDSYDKVAWVGFWDKVTRTKYNAFTKFSFELNDIDFHAKSIDLVTPAKNYIENFQMLPFKWAEKVVFKISPLFAVGGNEAEMNIPSLMSAKPSGDTIKNINKDFFLVFPQIRSGLTYPITLHQNPSFECGDNKCDTNLGESSLSCCYDCGCSLDNYCDIVSKKPETGSCKPETGVSLDVVSPAIPAVTDCSKPISINLKATVKNPPSSLPEKLSGIATINNTPRTVSCTKEGVTYTCPVRIDPPASCGAKAIPIRKNSINLSLIFNDGPNQKILPLQTNIPDFSITMRCACPEGFFCDSNLLVCSPEASVSMTILSVTSYLPNFNPAGDYVTLEVKINNPPSDLSVTGSTYTLGSLYKDSKLLQNQTTGSVTCSSLGDHVYECRIPITISNYDHEYAYFFKSNKIEFSVTFSNIGKSVVKKISSAFADVSIPSFKCGDLTCNKDSGETPENCCVDCGCPSSQGMYCDRNKLTCDFLNNVGLEVLNVNPTNVDGCLVPHTINITTQVTNPPSDLRLDFPFYLNSGVVQPFPFTCSKVNPGANAGLFSCALTIKAPDSCQKSALPYVFGPNSLNFTVSFSDGVKGIVGKILRKNFDDIIVQPVFTCGDNICEDGTGGTADLGESAANCCIDCHCETSAKFGPDFFCDSSGPKDPGVCFDKSKVKLVIDSPTAPVAFDSCETAQKLEILAHIENEPAQVMSSTFSGILNASNSEYLSCRKSSETSANASIQCVLRIPSIYECSQGRTYTYDPNSISVTLAFRSGTTTKVITSTSPLPTITTTQKIESLFDIIQSAMNKFRDLTDETKELIDELLDWTEKCIDISIILAIAGIASMFIVPGVLALGGSGTQAGVGAGGAVLGAAAMSPFGPLFALGGALGMGALGAGIWGSGGGSSWTKMQQRPDNFGDNYVKLENADKIKGYEKGYTYWISKKNQVVPEDVNKAAFRSNGDAYEVSTTPNTQGGDWRQAMQATAAVVQTIFQMWSKICELIHQQYQIQIQAKQMEASFIQSELCMDIVQHQIDKGVPAGQEQSVFNSMISCLSFANIENSMSQLQSSMQRTSQIVSELGNSFGNIEKLGSIIGGNTASLSLSCGGGPSNKCCGYGNRVRGYYYGSGSEYESTRVKINLYKTTGCAGGQYWVDINDVAYTQTSGEIGDSISIFGSTGTYYATVYCGQPGMKDSSSRQIGTPLAISFCRGTPEKGCYETSGKPSTSCKTEWDKHEGADPKGGTVSNTEVAIGKINNAAAAIDRLVAELKDSVNRKALVDVKSQLSKALTDLNNKNTVAAKSYLQASHSTLNGIILAGSDLKTNNNANLDLANGFLNQAKTAVSEALNALDSASTTPGTSNPGTTPSTPGTGTGKPTINRLDPSGYSYPQGGGPVPLK